MPGPIAVDLALMRDVLLPGLTLTPGRAVAARVVDMAGERGQLSIAGYLIDAELPRGLRTGDSLRLEVRDIDAHRVLLQITGEATQDPTPPPSTSVPLPGGATLTVLDEDSEQSGGSPGPADGHRLALALATESLGTVELRFAMDPATLRLDVSLPAGEPLQRADAASGALRDTLSETTGRAATVTVTPRREPVDLYA